MPYKACLQPNPNGFLQVWRSFWIASLMLPTPVLGRIMRYMGVRLTVFRFLPGFHSFAIFGLVLGKLP